MVRKKSILFWLIIITISEFISSCDKSTNPLTDLPFFPKDSTYIFYELNNNVLFYQKEKRIYITYFDSVSLLKVNKVIFNDIPSENSIIFFEGLIPVKVKEVQEEDGVYSLSVEPVMVTDVIKNCDLYWDFSPNADMLSNLFISNNKLDTYQHENKILKTELIKGLWKYVFTFEIYGSSLNNLPEVGIYYEISYYDELNKNFNLIAKVIANIRLPRITGSLKIKDNKLKEITLQNRSIKCDILIRKEIKDKKIIDMDSIFLPDFVLSIPVNKIIDRNFPLPININLGLDSYFLNQIISNLNYVFSQVVFSFEGNIQSSYNNGIFEADSRIIKNEIRIDSVSLIRNNDLSYNFSILSVLIPKSSISLLRDAFYYFTPSFSIQSIFLPNDMCKQQFSIIEILAGWDLRMFNEESVVTGNLIYQKNKILKFNCN